MRDQPWFNNELHVPLAIEPIINNDPLAPQLSNVSLKNVMELND